MDLILLQIFHEGMTGVSRGRIEEDEELKTLVDIQRERAFEFMGLALAQKVFHLIKL